MAHNFLSEHTLLAVTNFTSAAATGIVDSAVVDTVGYESIIGVTGFSATGSSNGMHALMGTASASGGLSEVLNSFVTALSTCVAIELNRPSQSGGRFVQFQAIREASCKLHSIQIWGRKGRIMPATQSTALLSSRVLGSPSLGQSTST